MAEIKIDKAAILMATYNGGRYLSAQIDSILAQTFNQWMLFIHDDGSTDNTKDIIKRYVSLDNRVHMLEYASPHGAKDNFLSLLQRVDAPYYFFCDQDDVWTENKMEKEMSVMTQRERDSGCDKPIGVYSDMYVADADLKVLCDSYMKRTGIYPQYLHDWNDSGPITFVSGCTLLINAAGRQAVRLPATLARMHDVWITLNIMKCGGTMVWINEPLMYYRQHGDNALGASDVRRLTLKYRLCHAPALLRKLQSQYAMLKALDYGPFIKYLYYKTLYKIRTINNI